MTFSEKCVSRTLKKSHLREFVTASKMAAIMFITSLQAGIVQTRRVPVQRAVEWDEIPYPYKVHDTTLRPLLNIIINSTIVVRNRSRS